MFNCDSRHTWVVEGMGRPDKEKRPLWWTVFIARQDHTEPSVIQIRIAPAEGINDYEAYAKQTITKLVEQNADATTLHNTLH